MSELPVSLASRRIIPDMRLRWETVMDARRGWETGYANPDYVRGVPEFWLEARFCGHVLKVWENCESRDGCYDRWIGSVDDGVARASGFHAVDCQFKTMQAFRQHLLKGLTLDSEGHVAGLSGSDINTAASQTL